jgi:hypothetical protein
MSTRAEKLALRLKEAGLFSDYRIRKTQLEQEGYTPKQAFNLAADEFTEMLNEGETGEPVLRQAGGGGTKKEPVTSDSFSGKDSGLRADYQWVYDNVALDDVSPESCPSAGAWGLLKFAKTHPKEFYVEWMRMVSRTDNEDEVLKGYREDARRATNDIADMLERFRSSLVQEGSEGNGEELAVQAEDTGVSRN